MSYFQFKVKYKLNDNLSTHVKKIYYSEIVLLLIK